MVDWKYNTYVVDGIGFAAGTFTGIDGHTVEYDEKIVEELCDTMHNKPVVLFHTSRKEGGTVVGNIINVAYSNGKAFIKYMIYDKKIYDAIRRKKLFLSIEATVEAMREGAERAFTAISGNIERVALEPDPACPSCVNLTAKEVQLSRTIRLSLASGQSVSEWSGGETAQLTHAWLATEVPTMDEEVKKLLENVNGKIENLAVQMATMQQHLPAQPESTSAPAPAQPDIANTIKTELATALAPFYEEQQRIKAEQKQSEIELLKATLAKKTPTINLETELAGLESQPDKQIERLRGMVQMAQFMTTQVSTEGESDDASDVATPDEGRLGVQMGADKTKIVPLNLADIRKSELAVAASLGLPKVKEAA